VCNHVSFVDALLIIGSTDRMIRAIMFQGIYDHPFVKPFARAMKAIPISSQLRPREMIKSLRTASEAIQNGDVVCIFAEGQITRIGQLLPFRRGFERVMKDVDAPIIPVCLDHVWGSIFSFEKGRFLWKMPRYVPYPVTVSFGKPMPPTSTPFEVRQAVQELNTEAWKNRRKLMMPIHRTFVRKARHHPRRFFMADGRVPKLRFGAALTRTIFLARRLRAVWAGQEMVGLLMPPSVGGALVNYAALLMGKVSVNLNYTANNEVIASCAAQCGLQTIVTSKEFLSKIKVAVPGKTVFLEELTDKPRFGEKLIAAMMTWTLPVALLEKALGREKKGSLDDLATIIFSSGSTGDPKGVMLTQYNIISNAEQLGQTFAFSGRDRILGILPFFHSFGFTGTLIVPAVLGIGVVYHVSPLDAKVIGALVSQYRVTFLLATPTFLQMYNRGCEPEDFGSLQFVMTGAEKLPDRIAQAFEDKFGIRPLEAYGLTECSPAVTVNTRDFRAAGFRQVGAKRGKIGHPLPAVSVRIVSPDNFQPLPVGQAGLLLIRGPNVMKGYLGKPEKTAEVLRDGWYVTGDIATLDEDGFLTITDRLTRFSKIVGEMVPHIKVEDKLHELAGATEQCFSVTGVPDDKKGERLVVLHTLDDGRLAPVLEKLAASDLPNLWKPRADQFFHIDALPYLGTGKLDLRKVRETAVSRSDLKQKNGASEGI
jgi:acyl-[acyl-carrier-protein]-phospholipid O-acyltransferase / long-chain-fatty-acid--[acyl-carrier-protein] ligase